MTTCEGFAPVMPSQSTTSMLSFHHRSPQPGPGTDTMENPIRIDALHVHAPMPRHSAVAKYSRSP